MGGRPVAEAERDPPDQSGWLARSRLGPRSARSLRSPAPVFARLLLWANRGSYRWRPRRRSKRMTASPFSNRSGSQAGVAPIGVTGPCVLAVSRGCFIAAPIATSGAVTGVGDRIDTHVPSSRRQPRWPAIGWTPLVLWNTQKRLSGPVHRRRWMPMRSGAAEGVGDAQLPYRSITVDGAGHSPAFSRLSASPPRRRAWVRDQS